MRELTFYTLDVFTDRIFGGNQLAVFPDAPELEQAVMQAIAREFNLSETVFVRPSAMEGALRRLRIFTPGAELPFAGHPTIGAAQLLVELGIAPRDADGGSRFAFEENVGLVAIEVSATGDGGVFTWLTAARVPEKGTEPVLERDALAALLGLETEDILQTPQDAPCVYSAGVPFLFIPLRDRDSLRRASLDLAGWRKSLRGSSSEDLYLFCHDTTSSAVDVHARMFAPAMGIAEDPATGGAAAAFAGYLWQRDRTRNRWIISQGEDMGRPSTLHVEAIGESGCLTRVLVGGTAVRVSQGTMRVP
jgi:trans-2,3-dihydro-3-hydroxyanthranilate isomerase